LAESASALYAADCIALWRVRLATTHSKKQCFLCFLFL
jgi:hypothetical protein